MLALNLIQTIWHSDKSSWKNFLKKKKIEKKSAEDN